MGLGALVLLVVLAAVAWLGFRPLRRLVETSFWSLNAIAVQPAYALSREALGHLIEAFTRSSINANRRAWLRASTAAAAGVLTCGMAAGLVILVWPHTQWMGGISDLASPFSMVLRAAANACAIVGTYLAAASLVWGLGDATMDQPRHLAAFDAPDAAGRQWRVAHLSDIHAVGERYGFRIESGRAGPRGNVRLVGVLARLQALHDQSPIDLVLITGDLTDAGRSTEWAEFLDLLLRHPALASRTVILPGNHDLNVVDRSNPARLELPLSSAKLLRQLRTLSAMVAVQGDRTFVFDRDRGCLGSTLAALVEPHRLAIQRFANAETFSLRYRLSQLWTHCFPLIVPPTNGGLGLILLNSNAPTNFSFTNALGRIAADDVAVVHAVVQQHPRTSWVIALHHHLIEYPKHAKALSERIGTALINGSWFVRELGLIADRVIVMHGHRHIDWIGHCGALKIVSAPSPVMDATDADTTCFHILAICGRPDGQVGLIGTERVEIAGQSTALR
jgi:hypothetical protein